MKIDFIIILAYWIFRTNSSSVLRCIKLPCTLKLSLMSSIFSTISYLINGTDNEKFDNLIFIIVNTTKYLQNVYTSNKQLHNYVFKESTAKNMTDHKGAIQNATNPESVMVYDVHSGLLARGCMNGDTVHVQHIVRMITCHFYVSNILNLHQVRSRSSRYLYSKVNPSFFLCVHFS